MGYGYGYGDGDGYGLEVALLAAAADVGYPGYGYLGVGPVLAIDPSVAALNHYVYGSSPAERQAYGAAALAYNAPALAYGVAYGPEAAAFVGYRDPVVAAAIYGRPY